MYLRPCFNFSHLNSKHTLFVAVRVGLTVDEDSPGSTTALGSGPGVASLCPCHVCLHRVPHVPGLQWTRQDSGALSHLMFCHARVQVSVTAHWQRAKWVGGLLLLYWTVDLHLCICSHSLQTDLPDNPWERMYLSMKYSSDLLSGEEPIENVSKKGEKSIQKNDEQKPYLSVSKGTSLIFILLLVEPDGNSSRLPSAWCDPYGVAKSLGELRFTLSSTRFSPNNLCL